MDRSSELATIELDERTGWIEEGDCGTAGRNYLATQIRPADKWTPDSELSSIPA